MRPETYESKRFTVFSYNGAEIQGARSPSPLNFALWRVIRVGLQYGSCFVTLWRFEVAPRFSENLCTPVLLYFLFLRKISLEEQSCHYYYYLFYL
jgi:hypothetical protein